MTKFNKVLALVSVVSTATLVAIAYKKYKEDKLIEELMEDTDTFEDVDNEADTLDSASDEVLEPIPEDVEETANSYCECGYGGKCFGNDFGKCKCEKLESSESPEETTEVEEGTQSEDASDEISEDDIEWADKDSLDSIESKDSLEIEEDLSDETEVKEETEKEL